ncbi:MAG TPA: copper chaperone [Lutibacter sp.]|nr:copper chaperone [Lutibacter sp.]
MKKIILVLVLLSYAIQGIAQDNTTKKKTEKATFWVNGNCEMCQNRIQKAALKTKGVKMAKWNIESDMLSVVYKTKNCNIADIKENIAKVGHDSQGHKATNEVYNNLHGCCQYDREDIPKSLKK